MLLLLVLLRYLLNVPWGRMSNQCWPQLVGLRQDEDEDVRPSQRLAPLDLPSVVARVCLYVCALSVCVRVCLPSFVVTAAAAAAVSGSIVKFLSRRALLLCEIFYTPRRIAQNATRIAGNNMEWRWPTPTAVKIVACCCCCRCCSGRGFI